MHKYLRMLEQLKQSRHGRSHSDGDSSRRMRKLKKVVIIVIVAVLVVVITCGILLVMAVSWLFNRGGDEIKQAGQSVAQQAQPDLQPLNLESYIQDGQVVGIDQLQSTYEALPSQLQGLWLDQLKTQIDDLQSQAGISSETVKAFTDLYNTLQQ